MGTPHSETGLVQQTVQIVASHDLTLVVVVVVGQADQPVGNLLVLGFALRFVAVTAFADAKGGAGELDRRLVFGYCPLDYVATAAAAALALD